MNNDLKRCPFCGGGAHVTNREKYWNNTYEEFTARCRNCNARIGPFKYRWMAEAAWNHRIERATRGFLDRLRKILVG